MTNDLADESDHLTTRTAFVFAIASILLLCSGPALGAPAAGRYLNTIDDRLELGDAGRRVVVTGPIGCPEGQLVDIHVQVSQESGATGTGRFSADCTGEQGQWLAIVDAWGLAFEPGDALAHAWATTRDGDTVTRSWDWKKTTVLASN